MGKLRGVVTRAKGVSNGQAAGKQLEGVVRSAASKRQAPAPQQPKRAVRKASHASNYGEEECLERGNSHGRLSLAGTSLRIESRKESAVSDPFDDVDLNAMGGQPVLSLSEENAGNLDDPMQHDGSQPRPSATIGFLASLGRSEDMLNDTMSDQEKLNIVEAVIDESDPLASPTDDLDALLHDALSWLQATGLLGLSPSKQQEVPILGDVLPTGPEDFRKLDLQLKQAIALSGRVAKGLEVKADLQLQAKQETARMEEKVSGLHENLQEKEEESAALRRMVDDKTEALRLLEMTASQKAAEERRYWQERISEQKLESERMREEMQMELRYLVEKARTESGTGDVALMAEQLTVVERELGLSKQAHAQLNIELSDAKAACQQALAKAETNRDAAETARDLLAAQKQKAADLEEEVAHLKIELENFEECKTLEAELKSTQARLEEAEDTLHAEREAVRVASAETDAKIADLTADVARKEAEGEELREQLGAQQAEIEALQKRQQAREEAEREAKRLAALAEQKYNDVRVALVLAWSDRFSLGVYRVGWDLLSKNNILKKFDAARRRAVEDTTASYEKRLADASEQFAEEVRKNTAEAADLQEKLREAESAHESAQKALAESNREHQKLTKELQKKLDASLHDLKAKPVPVPKEVPAQPSKGERNAMLQGDRVASDLDKAALRLSPLFSKKFRMKRFVPRATMLDVGSPAPPSVQIMRNVTSLLNTFATLLHVESKLRHLRRGVTVLTVAEKIRLKRATEKKAACSDPLQSNPQMAAFYERQMALTKKRIELASRSRQSIKDKTKQLWQVVTHADDEEASDTVQAFSDEACAEAATAEKQIAAEEYKGDVSLVRNMLEIITAGQWAFPAKKTIPTPGSLRPGCVPFHQPLVQDTDPLAGAQPMPQQRWDVKKPAASVLNQPPGCHRRPSLPTATSPTFPYGISGGGWYVPNLASTSYSANDVALPTSNLPVRALVADFGLPASVSVKPFRPTSAPSPHLSTRDLSGCRNRAVLAVLQPHAQPQVQNTHRSRAAQMPDLVVCNGVTRT
ncbi:hypothetical protein DIPPA_05834 [Diplonema papillatum]|nr:hypothetical protein DIPPA_05834 [Diplonema papillatum]